MSLDGNRVVFNATGGTKQMALLLTELLRDLLLPEAFEILYADTTHQRIDWLRPKSVAATRCRTYSRSKTSLVPKAFDSETSATAATTG